MFTTFMAQNQQSGGVSGDALRAAGGVGGHAMANMVTQQAMARQQQQPYQSSQSGMHAHAGAQLLAQVQQETLAAQHAARQQAAQQGQQQYPGGGATGH